MTYISKHSPKNQIDQKLFFTVYRIKSLLMYYYVLFLVKVQNE